MSRESFMKIKENDGTYVSKPCKNTCMASNHKSLHEFFWIVTGEILNKIQQDYGQGKNH
jgi:hypothetical protein